ncbi:CLE7, putative [Ricinus communis]|uniref:CLE7, putative n=1 Tax=Ricinus communis TaxID=3988 RepID=B9SGL3_RICCO|nr:CLE7, putative [Ricinus communis]
MAKNTLSLKGAVLLFLIIMFSILFLGCQARILKVQQAMQKDRDASSSSFLLHELGFDLSKLKRYQKLSALHASGDRVSPGGPDPHHHV